jgi:hypothetical protein
MPSGRRHRHLDTLLVRSVLVPLARKGGLVVVNDLDTLVAPRRRSSLYKSSLFIDLFLVPDV